jgi:DNA-binding SARP family transcriptional activator/tetratricopeptide (TPR) repeat protein
MAMPNSPIAFRLLGTVEVIAGGRLVELGPPQQQTVLASLVVDTGKPVSLRTLTERVWGDEPPAGARASLYAHLARIRRIVEQPDSTVALVRGSGGYVLKASRDWVDLHRFRRLTRSANATGKSETERAALLGDAIGLWRGLPLTGTSGHWAQRMCDSLVRERLDAVAMWADVTLRLGRPVEVVGTVRELVTEYPLAEPLVAALMRALAASGRAAESLELFAVTRTRLADELGADPGHELRAVHESVLRGGITPEPVANPVPVPVVVPQQTRRVPAQLPADVYAFTGRERELSALDALVRETEGDSTAVVVSAVSGTAGVGKTSLALRWAHRVRDRFPDGQLYLDLRGYDAEQPLTASDALARFLSALGLAGSDIPLDQDDRAARYRTELSDRRMLILLDNASTADQVRPLLPGAPGCLVAVTSRDSMAGLVARHGARRLDLDLLPLDDAVRLLGVLIGERVAAEPSAAEALAVECARLPLALRIAAELAAARPSTPLSELVDELADEQRRLDLFDAGLDPRTAVRAVFSWSYQHLTADAAGIFRLIGLHPGQYFDLYAAAALGDHSLTQARRLLDVLARAHLVQAHLRGRYVMHDLLRAYANQLANAQDSTEERRAALTRLLDFYLSTAGGAMNTLHPAEHHRRPRVEPARTPSPDVTAAGPAKAWLDAERANLVAACVHADAHGWPAHTVGLANTLFRYLDAAGLNADAFTIHDLARNAAARTGDGAGEARAILNLGLVYWHQGLLGRAETHLRQALDRYQQISDEAGIANALSNLGVVQWRQGNLTQAAEHLGQALRTYQRLANPVGQAEALGNLGLVYRDMGHRDRAVDHHQQALAIFQQAGHVLGEAYALNDLGTVHAQLGQAAEATEELRRALALFQQIGERAGEAETLNHLGEALYAGGALDEAADRHTAALAVAIEIGDRFEQARAHAGVAAIHESAGDTGKARACWQMALDGYAGLEVPEAGTVRAHLAALDVPTADHTVGL